MPRIPMGNFGNVIAQPAQSVRIPAAAFDEGGTGANKLGDTVTQVAQKLMSKETQMQEEVDRSQASVALIEHQSAAQDALEGIKEKLATGEISRDEAQGAFTDAMSGVREKTLSGVPNWLKDLAKVRIQGVEDRAFMGFGRVMEGQRHQQLVGNLEYIRATMANDAARPDADIDGINSQFEQVAQALGPQAGMPADKVGKLVKDFRAGNWFNQAKLRATSSRDSLEGVQQLERDLNDADGFYLDKLDPEKRVAVLRTVVGDRMRLETKLQHEADRRVADSDKAIKEFSDQITTTTRARPDDYLAWEARVRGTHNEGAFVELQAIEREVQKVVAMPPELQDKFLSDARAAQRINGANEKQIKMLNALDEAVGKNRKMMADEPLRYLTERTGQSFRPLTPEMLTQGGDAVEQEFRARVSGLYGLQKTTGGRTDLKSFSKDEADRNGKALSEATPAVQGLLLGQLRNWINDPKAYADTVRQVAKDDPVLALAGIAQGRNLTTTNGRALSELLLEGRSIIRDGSFKMPSEKAGSDNMQAVFNKYVGNAIEPGASTAREDTFKSAAAVYAKLAKDAGKNDGGLDSKMYEQAVRLVTGGVVEHAGYKTIPPYGMSSDAFNDRALTAKAVAEKSNDAPAGSFAAMQLRAVAPNRYELLNGLRRQVGKDGSPIILTIE